jgi:hypothetical protein
VEVTRVLVAWEVGSDGSWRALSRLLSTPMPRGSSSHSHPVIYPDLIRYESHLFSIQMECQQSEIYAIIVLDKRRVYLIASLRLSPGKVRNRGLIQVVGLLGLTS